MANKNYISIGDKFGKLTVIAPTQKGVMFDKKGRDIADICWRCKCDCGNEIDIRENKLTTEVSFIRSCGCSKDINPNYQRNVMSAQDVKDWDELYEYVRYTIMKFDRNQKLTRDMILRLQGLSQGKLYANNKTCNMANYTYKTILITFKYCRANIEKSVANKSFANKNAKFRYICAIVSNNLAEVYERIKNNKQSNEKLDILDMSAATHNSGAEYQRKTTDYYNPRLEGLW